MRQSAFAFTSLLVLAAATPAVSACGHTTTTLDAYEASKQNSGAGGGSSTPREATSRARSARP